MVTVFKQYQINRTLDDSHFVCYMCYALMTKLDKFIQCVVRAQRMLSIMLLDKKHVSLENNDTKVVKEEPLDDEFVMNQGFESENSTNVDNVLECAELKADRVKK